MAKAYWIAFYHSISDPEAMKKYAELARPAVESGGGDLWRGECLPKCMRPVRTSVL